MLSTAHFLHGVSHAFHFEDNDAHMQLLDETGENTLLLAGLKYSGAYVVLNDCIDGVWGEEIRLANPALGEDGHNTLCLKFNGSFLQAWTSAFVTSFDRFDATRAGAVRFMKSHRAQNKGRSLELRVLSPEAMTFEINHHLMHARLTQLEEMVLGQKTRAGPRT